MPEARTVNCPACGLPAELTPNTSHSCTKRGKRFTLKLVSPGYVPKEAPRPNDSRPPVPDAQPTTRVFISHSTADAAWIESALLPSLATAGISYWYSRRDLQPADAWERRLVAEVQASHALVLVMSPQSAASDWVKDEVSLAISTLGMSRILPVLLRPCDSSDFHIRLPRLQHIDCTQDAANGLRLLTQAIRAGGAPQSESETTASRVGAYRPVGPGSRLRFGQLISGPVVLTSFTLLLCLIVSVVSLLMLRGSDADSSHSRQAARVPAGDTGRVVGTDSGHGEPVGKTPNLETARATWSISIPGVRPTDRVQRWLDPRAKSVSRSSHGNLANS